MWNMRKSTKRRAVVRDEGSAQALLVLAVVAFMVGAGAAAFVGGVGVPKVFLLQGGGGGSDPSFVDNTYENFRQGISENTTVRWVDYENNDRLYTSGDVRLAPTGPGSWASKSSSPADSDYQGIAVAGAGAYLYCVKGPLAYRYDPSTDTWSDAAMADPPQPDGSAFKAGATLTWDNGDYLYAMFGAAGNENRRWFYRYSISGNSWTQLENTPLNGRGHSQGAADASAWVPGSVLGTTGDYIYAIAGDHDTVIDTAFVRYSISGNTWESVTWNPSWTTADDGASLVWTGGIYLYALRGEWDEDVPSDNFARFKLTDNTWTDMDGLFPLEPGGIGDGASLAWLGDNNYIYAFGGGSVNDTAVPRDDNFYRYSIADDSWVQLADIPFKTGYYLSGRLGVVNGKLYCWAGETEGAGADADPLAVFNPTYYIQGRFTSRVFDAGQVVQSWDNISWSASTPSYTVEENDNVGAEPETLIDDNSRVGLEVGGTITDTRTQDGYRSFAENNVGPSNTYPEYATSSGGSSSFSNQANVTGTPDGQYSSINTGTAENIATDLVISEVQIAGATTNDDFVEIYNPTNSDINLGSYQGSYIRLVKRTKTRTTNTPLKSWSGETAIVPAHGYWLWANSGWTPPVTPDSTTAGYIAADGSIALEIGTSGTYVDRLAYGSGHTAPLVEGTAYPTNPAANRSLERKAQSGSTQASMEGGSDNNNGNGYDENNNANDFIYRNASEPQNSSSTSETPPTGASDGDNIYAEGFDNNESGTITKVTLKMEYKVSAASTDDNFVIKYTLDNVTFGDTTYPFTPTATSDATVSVDVTSDRTWTWADIGKLRIWCFYDQVGTADGWTGYIDAIYVEVITGTVQYYLRWEHQIENVATGWENYYVKIKGYTGGDSENVVVAIWDNANSRWENLDNLTTTEKTITKTILGSQISNYLRGENIHIKYESADNTDSTQTTVYIDLCIAQQENVYETSIKFQIAANNDNATWNFVGPDGTTATYFETSPADLTGIGDNRYIKYRAYFTSEDNTLTPVLDWVQISYTTGAPTIQVTLDNWPVWTGLTKGADNDNANVDNGFPFRVIISTTATVNVSFGGTDLTNQTYGGYSIPVGNIWVDNDGGTINPAGENCFQLKDWTAENVPVPWMQGVGSGTYYAYFYISTADNQHAGDYTGTLYVKVDAA